MLMLNQLDLCGIVIIPLVVILFALLLSFSTADV